MNHKNSNPRELCSHLIGGAPGALVLKRRGDA